MNHQRAKGKPLLLKTQLENLKSALTNVKLNILELQLPEFPDILGHV